MQKMLGAPAVEGSPFSLIEQEFLRIQERWNSKSSAFIQLRWSLYCMLTAFRRQTSDERPHKAKEESPWFLLMYRKQSRQILRRFENEHIYADQTEHRVRPRYLGRWLVFPKADPDAAGGGS